VTKGRAVLPQFLFQRFGAEMDVSVHVAATLSYRADLLSVTSAIAQSDTSTVARHSAPRP
jgi:hypothetical protein